MSWNDYREERRDIDRTTAWGAGISRFYYHISEKLAE